jgi:uridylate kinase
LPRKAAFVLIAAKINQIADEIKEIHDAGVEMGIVIGAGNIFAERPRKVSTGRPATPSAWWQRLFNSLLIKEYFKNCGIDSRVLSAIDIPKAAEFFTSRRALHHLEKKRIVIIAGGTGNPYFTTDSAAALRCLELRAEVLLKATKVDGIYDSDPVKNPRAKRFDSLLHSQALEKKLKIMDSTAFSLCMEHAVPIIVFKLLEPGNPQEKSLKVIPIGTIVKKGA